MKGELEKYIAGIIRNNRHKNLATGAVVKYILSKEEYHHKKTFKEEYLDFLDNYGVAYKRRICLTYLIRHDSRTV